MSSNEQFLILIFKHFKSLYSYILLFVKIAYCCYEKICYIIVLVRSTEVGFISGILRLEINYYYYYYYYYYYIIFAKLAICILWMES